MSEKKVLWGLRESLDERHKDSAMFVSRRTAIEAGKKRGLEAFCVEPYCKASPPLISIEDLLGAIKASACTAHGEVANNWLNDVSKEDMGLLTLRMNDVWLKWLRECGYMPNYYIPTSESEVLFSLKQEAPAYRGGSTFTNLKRR